MSKKTQKISLKNFTNCKILNLLCESCWAFFKYRSWKKTTTLNYLSLVAICHSISMSPFRYYFELRFFFPPPPYPFPSPFPLPLPPSNPILSITCFVCTRLSKSCADVVHLQNHFFQLHQTLKFQERNFSLCEIEQLEFIEKSNE